MAPDWIRNLQRDANGHLLTLPDLLVQSLSDYGNGQRVIADHGDRLRYCFEFKTPVVYVGTHWLIDRTEAARALVQDTMVRFNEQARSTQDKTLMSFAARSLNSSRITNALLEAAPHLTLNVDQMDQHPEQLNCRNGTVDLRTGILRPHRRLDYFTKITPHEFHPDGRCPLFLAFLKKMIPGLVDYIKKLMGYTFTGLVREKKAFFCYGPIGNNGKTTLFHVIREVLGKDYCAMVPIELLMARGDHQSNNILAAMADLRGARFAWTSETDEGQRLSEAQLKRLTQGMGAPIQAARKFEHPITFPETHKLWAECNHRPEVRGTDNATWERIHLIPFDVTLTEDEIDRELPAKLAEEAEGILALGIDGAVSWFKERLGTPDAVSAAGGEWRQDSDQIGRFIAECCVTGDFAQCRASQLYQSYHKWAEDSGERRIVSNNQFAATIAKRGFEKDRESAGVVYRNIGLRSSHTRPE